MSGIPGTGKIYLQYVCVSGTSAGSASAGCICIVQTWQSGTSLVGDPYCRAYVSDYDGDLHDPH